MSKYSRQESCVPKKFHNRNILIIGAGAVGRNVALSVIGMGPKSVTIYDFDTVEDHNVISQGFSIDDIGKHKVTAVYEEGIKRNPDVGINCIADRWRPDFVDYDYVFLCCDCMTARSNIAKFYFSRKIKPVLIDTRMRGEETRILTAFNRKSRKHYMDQMFTNEEAADGNCTSSTTIYCAVNTASYAIQTMINHLRKCIVYQDVARNLSNGVVECL